MRPAARGASRAMVNASTDLHPDHPANDDERISNAGTDMGNALCRSSIERMKSCAISAMRN
jgi:hypothetical protein